MTVGTPSYFGHKRDTDYSLLMSNIKLTPFRDHNSAHSGIPPPADSAAGSGDCPLNSFSRLSHHTSKFSGCQNLAFCMQSSSFRFLTRLERLATVSLKAQIPQLHPETESAKTRKLLPFLRLTLARANDLQTTLRDGPSASRS